MDEKDKQALSVILSEVADLKDRKNIPILHHLASLVVVLAFVWAMITGYMDRSLEVVKNEVGRIIISLDKLAAQQSQSDGRDNSQDRILERHAIEIQHLKESRTQP